jgi:hypothetical protein
MAGGLSGPVYCTDRDQVTVPLRGGFEFSTAASTGIEGVAEIDAQSPGFSVVPALVTCNSNTTRENGCCPKLPEESVACTVKL